MAAPASVCEVCGSTFRRRSSNRKRRQPTCGARPCVITQTSRTMNRPHARHEAAVLFRNGQRLCECGGLLGDQHPDKGCVECQAKTEAHRESVRREERGPQKEAS